MLVDAHCHPFDLFSAFSETEQILKSSEILAASSACSQREFLFCEDMARNATANKARLFPCFGIHPQFFKVRNEELGMTNVECGITNGECEITNVELENNREQRAKTDELLSLLEDLTLKKKIFAVGECGFDLYNAAFIETEKQQDEVFAAQIEIALKHDLPLVLHVRRAMHKIFALTNILSKCKAVVFHSWSGTLDEAQSLLRRGVNAYFSFGNAVMLNHKHAQKSCALLSADRLLTETDAPYQPRRGESYSCWTDLPLILNAAAEQRTQAGNIIGANDLELQIERNFRKIFDRDSSFLYSSGSSLPLSP